ncbi:MAG: GNAT family N-acetyltransferase [Alteromonadaceae bacterium]|nr:GNAT family N-acetyltransferase [Alteromonadaceae bacterium]|tara:strand:- start:2900 stop:3427 length:528 start_codon:yes stop_codon:yes gene_type:complete
MNELLIEALSPFQLPLANKFYRVEGSKMRARRDEQVWIARLDGKIVAALRFRSCGGWQTSIDGFYPDSAEPACRAWLDGHWLLGVFTATDYRDRGIARALISAGIAKAGGPVWLFCQPNLGSFYSRLGFVAALALPEPLASRLEGYRRSQQLDAWVWLEDAKTPGHQRHQDTSLG